MNALAAKEIRQLLPAYAMALLLAVAPVWLLPKDAHDTAAALAIYPFWFGTVMLALSCFGREFGLKTFPLLLTQPLERSRIWWTKIAVLAGAMSTAFGAWCLSCAACVRVTGERPVWWELLAIGGTAMVVTFAGGLWTTLLLRQMMAAFWFTILVPGAILMAIVIAGGGDWMMFAALGLYSVAGFLWAGRYFLRSQETAWTGGLVALPGWAASAATARPSRRALRPLAALFWKELQLHQVTLAGMAWLFMLHLGVVALRRSGHDFANSVRTALEVFGGIWLLAPLVVASPSVAEERKLGTFEEQLCLPISRRAQFAFKLLFVLVLGGLLSVMLLWTAERFGTAVGTRSDLLDKALLAPFMGLAFIGFYTSTLTRSVVQALASSVVAVVLVGALAMAASRPWELFGVWMWRGSRMMNSASPWAEIWELFGVWMWRGSLVYYVGWPTLTVALLWLAWRNFRCVSEDLRLWLRNGLALISALVFIAASTSALYNRTWELLMPLEPAHGPARLTLANPPKLKSYGGSALLALLPDGRLWVDRIAYDPGRLILAVRDADSTGIRLGGRWTSLDESQFVAGSNLVDGVANYGETVAIRSDGTVWVSEQPRQSWHDWEHSLPPPAEPFRLVRFGDQTNWQSVVGGPYWEQNGLSPVLLSRDGELWRWGLRPRVEGEKKPRPPGLKNLALERLGTDSDWARILPAVWSVYAWKNDGRAWVLNPTVTGPKERWDRLEGFARLRSLDNIKWRSLSTCWPLLIGLREDGTLWGWNIHLEADPKSGGVLSTQPAQIGKDKDWVGVAGAWQSLAALKAGGSIWKWDLPPDWREEELVPKQPPVRLGTHNDWVAVGSVMGGTVSLAADGSLWYWWDRDAARYSASPPQPLLSASRRPARIENIFAEEK